MDDVPIHALLSNLIRDVSSVYEIVAYLSSRSSHAILWENHRSWTDIHRVPKPSATLTQVEELIWRRRS